LGFIGSLKRYFSSTTQNKNAEKISVFHKNTTRNATRNFIKKTRSVSSERVFLYIDIQSTNPVFFP